jgi:MSHA biogenesis protein MshP
MSMPRTSRRQRGFLIIAGVFLVVVLAGLVVYLSTVSTTSQAASAADMNAARAYQAARAGMEWGAYQILRNPGGAFDTSCNSGTPTNLTFAGTLAPFTASVTCTRDNLTEGASTGGTAVKSYRIVSNGCNEPTGGGPSCPNAATVSSTYVEREVRLTIAN